MLLDTTFARRAPLSGSGVYIDRLAAELARLDGVEVVAAVDEGRRPPAGGGLRSARNLARDRWWARVELPRRARQVGAHVIHHPLPAIAPPRGLRDIPQGARQVVTVHDLAFERLPECFDRGFRTYAHFSHRAAARAADAVVCVSETTAADVRALWGVPDDRIVVARHGPGQDLALPAPSAAPHAPEQPTHFLYVGDDEPRKDLPTLLAAYASYRRALESQGQHPLDLVLAGSATANAEGIRSEVAPSSKRLAELYAQAVALAHPSLYEGFGMTVLEAMSVGTPVIAARTPAITEVAGDAARYVPPRDPAQLAAVMTELASQAELRQQLAQRGRRRASEFSWAASARAHLAAYSLALEHR